jgi:hypothetical protein
MIDINKPQSTKTGLGQPKTLPDTLAKNYQHDKNKLKQTIKISVE